MPAATTVPPLRVVYLTQSPGDFSLDAPAYALAHTLRMNGDACLIGIGKLPLPLLDVRDADRYGIEQIALPFGGQAAMMLAGWRPFLRRFQPHIIHFGPDVAAPVARKLSRSLRLTRHAHVILEDATQLPHISTRGEALWHPMLYAGQQGGVHHHDPEHVATTVPSTEAAAITINGQAITVKRHPVAVAGGDAPTPDASFAGLMEPTTIQEAMAFAGALAPVVAAHPTFRCVLLARESLVKQWHQNTPADTAHLVLTSDPLQWQREMVLGVGAIGSPAHAAAPRLLGTALALNRPAIVLDAPSVPTPITAAPRLKRVSRGDAAIFLHLVSALIIQHAYYRAQEPAKSLPLSALEVAQQQRWMYYGLTMLANAAQKSEGMR